MRILGFVETSLVDWDGRISSVVFLGGCNFHCPYCQNSDIARDRPDHEELPWEQIEATLERKRDWVDAVTVTGGEPLMHPEIFEFCDRIKQLGFAVKIDTNGSFPYSLMKLIDLKLCDYVAMDVKSRLDEKYLVAAGRTASDRRLELALIRRSIRLLKESGVDNEFRTTLVPDLVLPDDIPAIGEATRDARLFVLQQYVPESAAVPAYRTKRSYTRPQAEAMADRLRPFVKEVKLRGKFL